MPIDLTKIPAHLKDAVRSGNLVPFIGAGVSLQGVTQGKPLPVWEDFMAELMQLARDDDLQPDVESQIATMIAQRKFLMAAQCLKESIDEHRLDLYIRTRFATAAVEPGPIHYALFKLQPDIIMTTNYDVLLEKAYRKKVGSDVHPITPKDSHIVQQVLKGYTEWQKPLIFKIHGTAWEPSEVVFAETDYRDLTYGQPGYRAVVSALFVTKVVLMLGFSNSDPEVAMVLQTLRESFKRRSSLDYIVLRKGIRGSLERHRLRKDFGLEVIEYDYEEDGEHNELCELVNYLAKLVPRRSKTHSSAAAYEKYSTTR